jgi:regulator of protease activity HflC (stomatin/prohibitin superfamily)
LDYSVDARGRYRSDDPTKLSERLSHAAQTAARSFTETRKLRDVLTSSDALVATVLAGLNASSAVAMLGVEVLGISILSIRPLPEISKAMQAEAREDLLRQADEAVYARRNNAVQLERMIKENELNTEVAVEQKRRQVRETQMEAEIAVEQQRATLVERKSENDRVEADARAHALQATLEPLKGVDWRTLMAASSGAADPKLIIALAFRELAENAGKIGELNVSPDLLRTLLATPKVDVSR